MEVIDFDASTKKKPNLSFFVVFYISWGFGDKTLFVDDICPKIWTKYDCKVPMILISFWCNGVCFSSQSLRTSAFTIEFFFLCGFNQFYPRVFLI